MTQRDVRPLGPPGHFYEGPRWRDDRWWVSDMQGKAVFSLSPDGQAREELRLTDDKPSGLGWLPDGTLLVVSMDRQALLYLSPGASEPKLFADLAPLCADTPGFLNDMGVTAEGHAYIGFDADYHIFGLDSDRGMLAHVSPDGVGEIATRGLYFPNAVMPSADGSTLIVAETTRPRFSAFAIGPGGTLGPASTWADTSAKLDRRPAGQPAFGPEPIGADGCCLDAEGHVWASDMRWGCVRIAPGGAIVDSIVLPGGLTPWACALGGEDGRSLLICGAPQTSASRVAETRSQLFVTRVETPGF